VRVAMGRLSRYRKPKTFDVWNVKKNSVGGKAPGKRDGARNLSEMQRRMLAGQKFIEAKRLESHMRKHGIDRHKDELVVTEAKTQASRITTFDKRRAASESELTSGPVEMPRRKDEDVVEVPVVVSKQRLKKQEYLIKRKAKRKREVSDPGDVASNTFEKINFGEVAERPPNLSIVPKRRLGEAKPERRMDDIVNPALFKRGRPFVEKGHQRRSKNSAH